MQDRRQDRVQYTVSSGGRTIGVTALECVGEGGPVVIGWFHPNEEGERLLPAIAAPQALAFARLRGEGPEDRSDALAALPQVVLALHRPDGSVVPATRVIVQDTHAMLAMAEWEQARAEAREDAPVWERDPDWPEPLDDAEAAEAYAELFEGAEPDGPWAPDDEPADLPRWQIVVEPVAPDDVP